ncbi:MAG: hypothetical protein Q4B94_04640 [Pseudomonadota bacterium]|nr:hypothetical protein [Pseudomonadota bacterium]
MSTRYYILTVSDDEFPVPSKEIGEEIIAEALKKIDFLHIARTIDTPIHDVIPKIIEEQGEEITAWRPDELEASRASLKHFLGVTWGEK